jgi:hypothetical protein
MTQHAAAALRSPTLDLDDYWEWDRLAREHDWTDGLPVAPPTEERVQAIIDHIGLPPEHSLGLVTPANGNATVEQVAIQCAMAGCLPEHVPVVMAALDCVLDPHFNLEGVQCTTNPCAPLTVVMGPQVQRLGFNFREGVFGGGAHANAAVGRALRLILWNLGGGKPNRTDRSPLGQPAKYAFCAAENLEDSPWSSLSEDFGFTREQDSVMVFACQSPYPAVWIGSAQHMLAIMEESLPNTGLNAFHSAGQIMVVVSIRPAQVLADAGFTRESLRSHIWENCRLNLGDLRRRGIVIESTDPVQNYWGSEGLEDVRPDLDNLPDDTWLPLVQSERDIHVLVTGGSGQWFAGYCPGWGNYGGFAVARAVTGGVQQ